MVNSAESIFRTGEDFARQMDAQDPLAAYRNRFNIPKTKDGGDAIYFAGNSLGLMPKAAREAVDAELDDWARLAVDAHFEGRRPWYSYHEQLREPGARLVGALPGEVVMMNSLTVNLHLTMATFYRPKRSRYKIVMDFPTFPSDLYAVASQIRLHGYDPNDAMVLVRPQDGEQTLHESDLESILEDHGDQVAMVLVAGVNFFTGQAYDIPRITAMAHREGCIVGLDLAHAAGNIPLALHDWKIDFAVWCSYKYLNSGPGAVAGAFIHEKHARDVLLPRMAGWWGNDPDTRFRMHLEEKFAPVRSADAWQISNPPIFSMAPLVASLAIFEEAGMPDLRKKSELLTGYLQFLIDQLGAEHFEVITPQAARRRGCQLSIRVHQDGKALFERLGAAGVKADYREPDVIRVAPVPLYNTFHDVWRFSEILRRGR